jgi:hypothetical protein
MYYKDIKEIIDILPDGRTQFYYFKDRYSLFLLEYFCGSGKTLKEIKSSRFAKLLDKRPVKDCRSKVQNAPLTADDFCYYLANNFEEYTLSLDYWGSDLQWDKYYHQTSRKGYNLVLQLNFGNLHDQLYKDVLRSTHDPFICWSHPVNKKGKHTMAWARMDIDLDKDEVLIEEIQNDWIRFAMNQLRDKFEDCYDGNLEKYVKVVLKEHSRLWDEAMLAATIYFIKKELGISNIYYHSYKSGHRLKNIEGERPPVSLYKALPKRFCFEAVNHPPQFLLEAHKSKNWQRFIHEQEFYLLNFN